MCFRKALDADTGLRDGAVGASQPLRGRTYNQTLGAAWSQQAASEAVAPPVRRFNGAKMRGRRGSHGRQRDLIDAMPQAFPRYTRRGYRPLLDGPLPTRMRKVSQGAPRGPSMCGALRRGNDEPHALAIVRT